MKNLIIFLFFIMLTSQSVNAVTLTNVVDSGINFTAKSAYLFTKYTLRAGKFIVVKTAKGTFAISKGILQGTNDAFKNNTEQQPVYKKINSGYTIPMDAELQKLPDLPNIKLKLNSSSLHIPDEFVFGK